MSKTHKKFEMVEKKSNTNLVVDSLMKQYNEG